MTRELGSEKRGKFGERNGERFVNKGKSGGEGLRRDNQSGYEPLNLENGSFLNSNNFDATDLRFNPKVKLRWPTTVFAHAFADAF